MPDATGRIRGIAIPRVPWHEENEEDESERECAQAGRYYMVRGARVVEVSAPTRETR